MDHKGSSTTNLPNMQEINKYKQETVQIAKLFGWLYLNEPQERHCGICAAHP